jgi:predicted site-specific integrase-resolvase
MSQDQEKYLRPEEVSKILQVTTRSLENWNNQGILKCIRTKGNHRRYLLSDVIAMTSKKAKRNICYCRVSTSSEKKELERQVEYFKSKYPKHEIIQDIGSNLEFEREGFNNILDLAFKGEIQEVVVNNKDILCKFGFELVVKIIEHSNGKILVLETQE